MTQGDSLAANDEHGGCTAKPHRPGVAVAAVDEAAHEVVQHRRERALCSHSQAERIRGRLTHSSTQASTAPE